MPFMHKSLKFKGYKCFNDEFAGFDSISPINIIIGRNNSGKSSLLDIIQNTVEPRKFKKLDVFLQVSGGFSEELLRNTFAKVSGGTKDENWQYHGNLLKDLKWLVTADSEFKLMGLDWENPQLFEKQFRAKTGYLIGNFDGVPELRRKKLESLVKQMQQFCPEFFQGKSVRRLYSDRDISREPAVSDNSYNSVYKSLKLNFNGEGATNITRTYINAGDKENLVEDVLLKELNQIFNPDNQFDRIQIKDLKDKDNWEIYLEEKHKGRIPLSKSGSGLKTVLLVLLNLWVVPDFEETKLKNSLFCFEELENNLHPSLLRRLFQYLEDFAIKNGCHFFITTHSNVVIDMFSQNENAQIIHVTHNGKNARTRTINSFSERSEILDDIGVKASDLMQANGIVWLEGPSDRIYFNKWIEIYSDGALKEHRDYECAIFGGSILAHFEAIDPTDDSDAINILRANRNSILIADSDKTSESSALKPRLQRMKDQMQAEEIGAHIWITEAKEIENYIPATVLGDIYDKQNLPEISRFQIFHSSEASNKGEKGYWQTHEFGSSYNKVKLAREVVRRHPNRSILKSRFDLEKEMTEICRIIKSWNSHRKEFSEE